MPTEWQWHYLAEDITESAIDSGTVRIKLPEREQISIIDVEIYATLLHPDVVYDIPDVIEKMEVIADGSSILYSMSPETGQFIHFCTIRSLPLDVKMFKAGLIPHFRCKIPFGRWERDEEYMLDTSVYNNVYLEIPWSMSTFYFTTHTFSYTVRYLRPIQKLAPKGFIRSRDIEYGAIAWAAVGHHYVDLPLHYPWYMLGCRMYDRDADMVTDFPHVKLDIDDGRLVLVDEDTDDIMRDNTERLPSPLIIPWKVVCTGGSADYIRSYLGRVYEAHIQPFSVSDHFDTVLQEMFDGQQIKFQTECASGVACASCVNISLVGEAYNCCLIIKDWYLNWYEPVPHEPFDVSAHSEVQLDYTHAAITVEDLVTFLQEVCPAKI
jgi:hypothetical protein